MKSALKITLNLTILLTFLVIALGAYTRLTDAGLGCPDWPGCYGMMHIPAEHHADIAQVRFPERPLEVHKARNEMVHRYLAGTLGLFVLAIFVMSCLWERRLRLLPSVLLLLVVFQATLGMWTVTLKLFPVVVMAHLLGGFLLLSLLALYRFKIRGDSAVIPPPIYSVQTDYQQIIQASRVGALAGIVLLMQIALGGWTSANYAALSCVDFPICHGGWTEQLDFKEAFNLHLDKAHYEFGVMPREARQTVQIMHRFGAVLTLFLLGLFAMKLMHMRQALRLRFLPYLLLSLLIVQFTLGILNIAWKLPLSTALAHNMVAAALFMVFVLCFARIRQLRRCL